MEGVEVLFQDFECVPYPQIGSPDQFVPYLSVVDGLMNVGPEGTLELARAGTKHWLTWGEMKSLRALRCGNENQVSPEDRY